MGMSQGVLSLKIMIVTENFPKAGKYVNPCIELNMCVNKSKVFLGSCITTSAVIKS